MQQALLQNPSIERSEHVWALHWYRLRHQHPLATDHLWAYLQDPSYWAADKVTRRFAMVQCSLADGFQIAIANVERILNGYDPDYGSNLKAYARTAFGNCIRDQLRQQHEVNISSDWGLLRRLSQTQLTQALLTAGFVQTSAPILVWKCFRAECSPEPGRLARGLPAPNETQLNAMVNRFNRERYQLLAENEADLATTAFAIPDFATTDIDTKQMLAELTQLAAIARSYLTPTITSLNQPQYDDSGEEPLNTLPAAEIPMNQILADEAYHEQQQQMQQIGAVLETAITALDIPEQQLLQLYYQQNLTQTEIAQQLDIQQYQVSRKLSRLRQQLLLRVINWSQKTLHTPPESDVLANVSQVIHEWLQYHYSP
ncbi:sigma-70 family RNA polymerase sigma factor [Leptolyngbya cf. ectocarpi LEGE 11479]|uniref:Sigma-70 family RNA polymerase sigma factor n=1 Tax=Leptolyngbya cf. ectocarpi LEGE 11479 TaxID=1828722 RepID=A0A928ZVF5_LEPEC|nr:sigma-70 family RNA polymerase sigma factor [Leptolyngbya ectocarpi]MBE9068085.1 sigma-70 family RNA polymerase sigma factor [Leptolyngbya cf. ectocarpi LEGE 11479]